MLAENYSYSISVDENSLMTIVVQHNSIPEKTKVFKKASGSVAGMTYLMESLTDECCDQYFPKPRKNKS